MPSQNRESERRRLRERYLQNQEAVRIYQRAYYARNKERIRAQRKNLYHADLEKARAKSRAGVARSRKKRQYGMDQAQIIARAAAQGGCGICRASTPGKLGWCVDHCHVTGRVRGVLCTRCNSGIGMLRDNAEMCVRAAQYLGWGHG